MSFDQLVGLIFLLGCIEGEDPLHSFPTKFEPKPGEIFCGPFCYCGVAVIELFSVVRSRR
jgi:hypothetical protein